MIKYDDSSLNVEQRGKLPLFNGLKDFAMKLSLAKPMINFVVDTDCVKSRFMKANDENKPEYKEFINSLNVYERGERLGSISCDIRYRGSEKELVYEVESFRISKSRGARDKTASKDIKVALRLAKKTLVARADEEASILIRDRLNEGLLTIYNSAWNAVRWGINANDEAFLYARMAYLARQVGEEYVSLPTKLATVTDRVMHDKQCAEAEDATCVKNIFLADRGYGVQVLADGSLYVYTLMDKSIKRYNSFDDLPDAVQSKYAMFKVLKELEVVPTIGVKLREGFAFVVG